MSGEKAFINAALSLGLDLCLDGFEDYLKDESRYVGSATGLIRVRGEQDVTLALQLANEFMVPLTVVSGKTSITGASAPQSGFILNVKNLDSIDEENVSHVGAGVILKDYKKLVESRGYFYPPDPTSEDSCTIGGTIACNASGSLSYLYGPTRNYIEALRVALPDGPVLDVERGRFYSEGGHFRIKTCDMPNQLSEDISIPAPRILQPSWNDVKNAAGLFSDKRMDLVDLFIGGDGILGVVLSARTRLLKRRDPYFALMIFVSSRYATVTVVQTLDYLRKRFGKDIIRNHFSNNNSTPGFKDKHVDDLKGFKEICPSCIEWFGSSTAELLDGPHAQKLDDFYGALYVEQDYANNDDMYMKLQKWSDLLELLKLKNNIGRVETEAALDEKHLRSLRLERIRVPERLNERIRPGLRKIGTDLSVPMDKLDVLMRLYDDRLPKGASFVFGHIGNAHLHANIMARESGEMERFNELHLELAKYVCSIGGSVSGEHGVGKLKKKILGTMIGDSGIHEIRRIKSALDPNWILNPGNMVDRA